MLHVPLYLDDDYARFSANRDLTPMAKSLIRELIYFTYNDGNTTYNVWFAIKRESTHYIQGPGRMKYWRTSIVGDVLNFFTGEKYTQ